MTNEDYENIIKEV